MRTSEPRFDSRGEGESSPPRMETAVIDPRNRFSISYVPRMSEHPIETGRTTAEAQFKVILLAGEVERLAALNYTLVKENEVLRAHADKATREKDLEMKLAIVLAENEKLNQVIDEIANLNGGQLPTAGGAGGADDKRLQEVLRELERWKDENQILRNDNKQLADELEKALSGQSEAHERLHEENVKRAGLGGKGLAEEVARLRQENDNKDAEIERLKAQIASGPQAGLDGSKSASRAGSRVDVGLRQSQFDQAQQDSQNKAREIQELKDKLDLAIRDNQEIADFLRSKANEAKNLADENANLKKIVDQGVGHDTVVQQQREQLDGLLAQLNQTQDALGKKAKEADDLRAANDTQKRTNAELTGENDRLRAALQQTSGDRENIANAAKGNTEKLLQELTNLQNLLAAKSREADDFKHKHALLTMENERVSQALDDKFKENKVLKEEVDRLKHLGEQSGGEKDSTINQQKEKIDQLVKELDTANDELTKKRIEADDYKNRIPLLTMENERLSGALEQKHKECEDLKRVNQAMFNDIENLKKILGDRDKLINTQLKPQLGALVEELTRAQAALDGKNKENQALATQNRDLIEIAKQHEDLKQKVGLIALENERLANTLKDMITKNDEQSRRLRDLEAGSGLIDKLNQQVKGLQDQLQEKDRENQGLKADVKNAGDRHHNLREAWANVLGDIEGGNRALGEKIHQLLSDMKEDK